MPEILNPLNVTVNTGGTITLPTVTSHNIFIFSGTSTLASGYNIVPDSGAVEGMLFTIKWNAQVTYSGGNVVTIFGTALTQVQAVSELTITCYYNGSSWEVDILVDAESLPNNYNGVETTTVPSGGGTVTLLTGTNKVTQHFIGTVTLSSSYTITAGGFPSNGDRFEIVWSAVCTLGVNSVTIFGISLDSIQALSGNVTVVATYNGSAWIAELIQGELKTNAVTNPMLAQMPTMTIKGNLTGGTANAADNTLVDLKTALEVPDKWAISPFIIDITSPTVTLSDAGGVTVLESWLKNTDPSNPFSAYNIFNDNNAYRIQYKVHFDALAATIASDVISIKFQESADGVSWSDWSYSVINVADFPESANTNLWIDVDFFYAMNTSVEYFRWIITHSPASTVDVKRRQMFITPLALVWD